jgi:NADP-dependent 3-hydroxy acid dehydrogenase YdfG
MLAFAWPTRGVKTLTKEDMLGKVVVITGASSAIGEVRSYRIARQIR